MNTRPAWGLLLLGALVVAALFLSPLWLRELSPYIEEPVEEAPFPDEFFSLANEAQEIYSEMYDRDRQMAVDFVAARLVTPEPLDEPNLPLIDPNPSGVTMLLSGSFVTLDPVRGALGTASLYRLSDGRRLLRLESFEAVGGPELHVLLSAYPNPTTKSDLDQVARLQLDLGPLKSGAGSQNYIITDPAFNVENYTNGSVVIYSLPYETVFSYASLTPPP
ncbi:MAG: DM13 domain-containing protein, partial [Chloroflexota bacterium]